MRVEMFPPRTVRTLTYPPGYPTGVSREELHRLDLTLRRAAHCPPDCDGKHENGPSEVPHEVFGGPPLKWRHEGVNLEDIEADLDHYVRPFEEHSERAKALVSSKVKAKKKAGMDERAAIDEAMGELDVGWHKTFDPTTDHHWAQTDGTSGYAVPVEQIQVDVKVDGVPATLAIDTWEWEWNIAEDWTTAKFKARPVTEGELDAVVDLRVREWVAAQPTPTRTLEL